MLKILLFFIIVSGRKHIFLNILHLDFFFLFWNVPWIASEYWRRFKSPSAAAVQACLTRCTVSHVQQKKVYHEVYNIQIPCFVINDNNFLCLYASDKVSRFVKGVFSVATHHIWTDPHLFQNPQVDFIIFVVSILRDPVTWSKKSKLKYHFWL